MEVTPPSALERTKLPPMPVASSVAGVALQDEGPTSSVEVAATAPRQEQPDVATVVSEGAAESTLPEAQAEVTATSPVPLDVATVASEEAVQSAPPAALAAVTATATSPAPQDVATVASEGAAQSAPPAAQAAAPEAGRSGEDTAVGSPGIVVVVEKASGGSPSALVSGGSCSPARGESPLHWMDP
ncbi:predicted GPI-anchored protein 58 [Miscanthus floridulus]|uniref:predicted GPI-anchored protein 58 n=1 Tax=Miscanthus floridulus TaxID=154761 RepID=UPI0034589FE8